MRLVTVVSAALGVALVAFPAPAQTTQLRDESLTAAVMAAAATAQTDAAPATLSYANRDIVLFRASVLSRPPAERAAAAVQILDRLVEGTPTARVGTLPIGNTAAATVGERVAFFILPGGVSPLAGEAVQQVATDAAGRLQHANILDAFNEYGVQITSPNYEADPGGAKVVPPERWYAAPAVRSGETV